MKTILFLLTVFIPPPIVLWAMASFITLVPNPGDWPIDGRAVFLLISFIATGLWAAFLVDYFE